MGCIRNIKTGLRIKNAPLVLSAVKKISNWHLYFLDFFSLALSKEVVFRLKNGFKIKVRTKTSDRGILTSVYLADEYKINDLSLPKDATVIDIGANIGIFSILASKKAKKIFSYEAVSYNYEIFKENIEINKLRFMINPFNLAVAGKRGKIKVFLMNNHTGGHSIHGSSKSFIEVNCITLKDVFDKNRINKCDLLKIDAEGSEYDILYNLSNEYFKKIKMIYLEHHDLNNPEFRISNPEYTPSHLKTFLEEKGFIITQELDCFFAKHNEEGEN